MVVMKKNTKYKKGIELMLKEIVGDEGDMDSSSCFSDDVKIVYNESEDISENYDPLDGFESFTCKLDKEETQKSANNPDELIDMDYNNLNKSSNEQNRIEGSDKIKRDAFLDNDNENDNKIDIADLLNGDTFIISGGQIKTNNKPAKIEVDKKKSLEFYTTEQLKNVKLNRDRISVSGRDGIIDPRSKFRKKKEIKRCKNFDDIN